MAKLDNVLYGHLWRPFASLMVIVLLLPLFVKSSYILTVLILIGIYSLISIGLSLLLGYAGQISLGHAAFFGIGAYVSGVLTAKYAGSPWIAMVIGIVFTWLVSYVIGMAILRLKGHFLALATMAINIIFFILILGLDEFTGGASGLVGIPSLSLFQLNLGNPLYFYFFVWFIVFVIILFSMNIIRSNIGRLLRSIHDSEIATETLGVNVAKYKVIIFSLSAVYASLAGSLYAHFISFIAPPSFYITFSILLLVMVMVGGVHSIWGAVLGTAIIMFLNEWIRYIGQTYFHISGQVEIVVYGLIIILVMMFMPKGLVDILERLWKKIKSVQIKGAEKRKMTTEKGA
ncbi:amino acid/amide ABC transporter membrane protein 2 (HAAT family) [Anoxybacillus vitaminiphilus]|uniref:Amino acid/amide ABC transporter membrane protein 2 (HAAT family) n=1 Tax=Paranoxybacillus vitaminiphilus TaxID=581036 RepID=A0A327Y3N2_9BACL|nr:branched-chain amino acid ABC transporter permease [Anoxybacillus vitaminiphilus]RAK15047.1 amino acid/amide ABC transporter membrane protein 2 (HAAT family) [Anoxybacillus vitaminiphilus]